MQVGDVQGDIIRGEQEKRGDYETPATEQFKMV